MKKAILALSGGMDSTCLLLRLLRENFEVTCILFDYGQKHKVELERALRNINHLKKNELPVSYHKVDLSFMSDFGSSLTSSSCKVPEGHYSEDNMKSTVVPNRNAIFSSIIYGYALSLSNSCNNEEVVISLGIHSGDHAIYPDCRPEFRDSLEKAFKLGNWGGDKVSYYTPFIDFDKTMILRSAMDSCEYLGLSFDFILGNTLTSYNPDSLGRSSGKSGSDIERIEAFMNISRIDPIQYQEPWEAVKKHALKILNKFKDEGNTNKSGN